jgi:hypothetical protein
VASVLYYLTSFLKPQRFRDVRAPGLREMKSSNDRCVGCIAWRHSSSNVAVIASDQRGAQSTGTKSLEVADNCSGLCARKIGLLVRACGSACIITPCRLFVRSVCACEAAVSAPAKSPAIYARVASPKSCHTLVPPGTVFRKVIPRLVSCPSLWSVGSRSERLLRYRRDVAWRVGSAVQQQSLPPPHQDRSP